jgi:hypothetical protein
MKVEFINFNGIKEYARVMYNDVKDADKYRIDVAYNGKDIKALLEYLFELEKKVEILEEPKGIPEKLEAILEYSKDGNHISKVPNNEQLMFKINEILDYLKSRGE